jgi:beta-glucosidase
LARWTRDYGDLIPPMYVTENGVAYDDGLSEDGLVHDDRRISYLNDHLLSIESAIARGADVRGYFQWSLMDNFEWAEGFNKRFGIVHVDFDTQVRTVKESGKWYGKVIETNGENLTRKFVKFS